MLSLAQLQFLIAIFFIAITFLISVAVTPFFRKMAIKINFLDNPGKRKEQKSPIPMIGGIIILFSTSVILGLLLILLPLLKTEISGLLPDVFKTAIWESFSHSERILKFSALVVATLILWATGVADDFFKSESAAKYKFAVHILCACIVVFVSRIHMTFFQPLIISQILSVIWIVGIINSFNLLDNMDGLSGGVATICLITLLGISIWQGEVIVAGLAAIFIGAFLGFLFSNLPPAKIYLGDNGSTVIGLLLGVITLKISYIKSATSYFFPILIPIIILAIPLVDTFSVIVIRIKNKQPIYVGDKNHVSHRLLKAGFSRWESLAIIYVLTFSTSSSGFLLLHSNLWFSLIILIQICVTILLFLLLLIKGKSKSSLTT